MSFGFEAVGSSLYPDQFVGHEFLDDEVSTLRPRYRFQPFTSSEILDGFLQVDSQQDETLSFIFTVGDPVWLDHPSGRGENTMRKLGFAVVNELLERMNWINANE